MKLANVLMVIALGVAVVAGTAIAGPVYKAGQTVAAKWGSSWYIASIDEQVGEVFAVTYGDNTEGKVDVSGLRPMTDPDDLAIGDRVLALRGRAKMLPGTITAKDGKGVTVKWDDDSEPSAVKHGKISKVGPATAPATAPPTTNWSARPAVITQCGTTFDGEANEHACLDAVTKVRFDPVALIRACDVAMDGDENELACIRVGVVAAKDLSPGLTRCEAAMDGDGNELACFKHVIRARYAPDAMVIACEAAMDGDENELACVTAAVGAETDPTETIRACEASMDGDASELACIKRATGAT